MEDLINLIENDTVGKYDFSYSVDRTGVIDVYNPSTGYVALSEGHLEDHGVAEICDVEFSELNMENRQRLAEALLRLAGSGRSIGSKSGRIEKSDIITELQNDGYAQ
jgi:hypothetical protein